MCKYNSKTKHYFHKAAIANENKIPVKITNTHVGLKITHEFKNSALPQSVLKTSTCDYSTMSQIEWFKCNIVCCLTRAHAENKSATLMRHTHTHSHSDSQNILSPPTPSSYKLPSQNNLFVSPTRLNFQ